MARWFFRRTRSKKIFWT